MSQHLTEWGKLPTSIFSVMTQKAIKHGAINLAQGFPDFDGPELVKEAAIAAIRAGKNQYAPATGIPELRAAIARYEERYQGLRFDPDTEVTVFSGATEALFCTIASLCRPGDEVIAFAPVYDSYGAAAMASGAKIVEVPLVPPCWQFDQGTLEKAVTSKTRLLLINTPHNPSGRVFSLEELTVLANVAKKHDLLVVMDEVYQELYFEPSKHVPMASLPGMAERTISISSTSKTFSMTGWKVGFAFAKPALSACLRGLHQYTVFCSATPLQWGMLAAFENLGDAYFSELREGYRNRRDLLLKVLRDAGFTCETPEGSYFVLANYEKHSKVPDREFADWLIEKHGVATIPISPFYQDHEAAADLHYVRFGFCKGEETIRAAAERLAELNSTGS